MSEQETERLNAAGDATPEPQRRQDRAEEAGYPPDHGPEQDVLIVRRAMLRAAPMRFILLFIVLFASLGLAIWLLLRDQAYLAALAALVGLGVTGYLVWWKVLCLTERLRITNKRTIDLHGIFSRSSSEVLHDNIRNVKIDQSFWDRVWNIGRISISSSGTDEEEIQMGDVPRPNEVARIIDLYRPLG